MSLDMQKVGEGKPDRKKHKFEENERKKWQIWSSNDKYEDSISRLYDQK